MNILMFLIGTIIFTFYIVGWIWESKQEEKQEIDWKNYYERHSLQRKKQAKRKKGSQSRMKNYNNKWKKKNTNL